MEIRVYRPPSIRDLPKSGSDPEVTGRVGELDSLRALAALAVIIFHANEAWLPFGWTGVDNKDL